MAIDVSKSLTSQPNDGHHVESKSASSMNGPKTPIYHRQHHWYHPIIGLFLFYVGHDALQERMFRFDGFEFGFFMTLIEVLVMLAGSLASEGKCRPFSRMTRKSSSNEKASAKTSFSRTGSSLTLSTLIRIAWIGLFLAFAHGLGNTALRYSPYPLKVSQNSN